MYGDLTGKVVLVTGGGSGIGRAAALAFARAGSRVIIAGIDEKGGSETAELIHAEDSAALSVHCDVSREDDVRALMELVRDKFGMLHAAFNNAGIEGYQAPAADITVAAWRHTLDVNITGAWLCMRYEIPLMLESGGGAIVNCASILGIVGFASSAAYAASKHALIGLTQTAALDYAAKGIRINAVCPGFIETPMLERAGVLSTPEARQALEALHPMNRLGLPAEVANAVVWLCTPGASFVTGVALPVDGGYLAR